MSHYVWQDYGNVYVQIERNTSENSPSILILKFELWVYLLAMKPMYLSNQYPETFLYNCRFPLATVQSHPQFLILDHPVLLVDYTIKHLKLVKSSCIKTARSEICLIYYYLLTLRSLTTTQEIQRFSNLVQMADSECSTKAWTRYFVKNCADNGGFSLGDMRYTGKWWILIKDLSGVNSHMEGGKMNLNIHRTVMRIFLCILNVRVGELSERGGTASVRRQCSPPFPYTVFWNITVLLLCIADPKIDITSDVTLWGFSPGKVLFYITGRVNILNFFFFFFFLNPIYSPLWRTICKRV